MRGVTQVTQLLAPAGGERQALGTCFASASEDGSVCITALATPFESRSLPGYPGGVPCSLSWVPTLGYLACLFKLGSSGTGQPPEPASVTVVWDAHSCALPWGPENPLWYPSRVAGASSAVGKKTG